jgi:hypothetical protein
MDFTAHGNDLHSLFLHRVLHCLQECSSFVITASVNFSTTCKVSVPVLVYASLLQFLIEKKPDRKAKDKKTSVTNC